MVTYLTREEAEKLVCPFLVFEQQWDCCIVDECHAWEWVKDPWDEKVQKGFCALCHKEVK